MISVIDPPATAIRALSARSHSAAPGNATTISQPARTTRMASSSEFDAERQTGVEAGLGKPRGRVVSYAAVSPQRM